MPAPNPAQQRLINGTEGCYLVDAGPGTGKTFTITRRYANILDQSGIEPDDILLITFTRNAAREIRDRIVDHSDYPPRTLVDAPIQTFHSLCHDILREGGFEAPHHLGINEILTGSTRLLEDVATEQARFRTYMGQFTDRHPEYAPFFSIIDDPTDPLTLLNSLAAKGVIPTADGWYRDSEEQLHGNQDAFEDIFDTRNQQPPESDAQSPLRSDLNDYGSDVCYTTDAPDKGTIRGNETKLVPEFVKQLGFDEDRSALIEFVHDLYFEYLTFALKRNYLNFGFLQALAYVHLCERDDLRNRLAFQYVMIDEFQDTSEIQFKLALLLSRSTNLCVVGDWKQSIYSFQYAAVENITAFDDRLETFVSELNHDRIRVDSIFNPVHTIDLNRNYRSTQALIDRAEHALEVPGSRTDDVDIDHIRDAVVSLQAETELDHSCIEAIQHEDESGAILTKIDEIVGNEAYGIREEEELRLPTYGDIAVVTRTRKFGRDLLELGEEYGFPMAYEGDIELFRTDPAKFVLAWLRILEDGADRDRGWAVILEYAGYRMDEIEEVLTSVRYPDDLLAFRDELIALEPVGAVAHRVCSAYGQTGGAADQLCRTLQSVYDSTTMTRGNLIQYIDRGIENGTTREVTAAAGQNAVKIKTIHATKGLEYPIVLMANMNRQQFPSTGNSSGAIVYDERFGLRQRKVYAEDHGTPHVYRNWRWDILRHCQPNRYDEERRLLYVAMTRARDHVIFSAGDRPSRFFEAFPIDVEGYEPNVQPLDQSESVQTQLRVEIPVPEGPSSFSPHDLMEGAVFEDVEGGRGMAFGSRVHHFAEAYARGESHEEPESEDEHHVASFIDSLSGDILTEQDAYLPLEVDGTPISLHGKVDLVHITENEVHIIDYKTDEEKAIAEDEYRKQLSIYYHVVASAFPDRKVTAALFYTADNSTIEISPLSIDSIKAIIRKNMQ